MTTNIIDKYMGTLLGGCCGDVLGSQTEGMTHDQIVRRFGGEVTEMPEGKKYTDDTEMTLVLARHLVEKKSVHARELHAEYGNAMSNKGYSSSTRAILQLFKDNPEHGVWASSGKSSHNGAVMRIAPIGLMKWETKEVMKAVRDACHYTHGANEDAMYSALLHCCMINALVNERFTDKLDYWTYVMNNARFHSPLWTKINLVRYCLNHDVESITEELLGSKNAFQIKAIDALCCAFYTFFRHFDDPRKAVQCAASMGGDTDTIAKIVGELCGALHGTKWIPNTWHGVEGEEELIRLARALIGEEQPLVQSSFAFSGNSCIPPAWGVKPVGVTGFKTT